VNPFGRNEIVNRQPSRSSQPIDPNGQRWHTEHEEFASRVGFSGRSTYRIGLASPTLAAQLAQEIETATAQGASAVAFGCRPHPDRAWKAYRRGVRWTRDAAPAWPCPPGGLVGAWQPGQGGDTS
jgi:hypothetical protein